MFFDMKQQIDIAKLILSLNSLVFIDLMTFNKFRFAINMYFLSSYSMKNKLGITKISKLDN